MKIKNMAQIAREMVESGKYREINGPNRSPEIDELCRIGHVPLGSSWCTLFACEAHRRSVNTGASGAHMPYTAGSQFMLAWFRKHGLTSDDPQDLLKWKGALLIRTNPDGKHGHVALAEKRLTTFGKIVAVGTLEGNTDANGGSNGDRAAERERVIPLTPYKWTFCNTSSLAGGTWW
jgi:hypothetical protein